MDTERDKKLDNNGKTSAVWQDKDIVQGEEKQDKRFLRRQELVEQVRYRQEVVKKEEDTGNT
jgi:hypothetical protein